MFGLLIVVVIVLVLGALIVGPDRRSERGAHRRSARHPSPLAAGLQRAVEAGVLTSSQADAVLDVQPPSLAPTGGGRRVPALAEALAYLGAVLVIAGAVVAVEHVWIDMAVWTRLLLVGAVAAGFSATGAAIPETDDRVWWRLHGFCWLLGTGALALFTALVAGDVLGLDGKTVTLATGAVVALDSALLWQGRDRPLQHLSAFAGLVAVVVGAVTLLGGTDLAVAGGLWALGALWLALGTADLLRRHPGSGGETVPSAAVGQALGALTVLVAAALTGPVWEAWSAVAGLVTAVALVVLGSVASRPVPLVVGVAGLFVYLPTTVLSFFAESVGVPLVLVLAGGALLGGVAAVSRRRTRAGAGGGSSGRSPGTATGSHGTAGSPPPPAAPASRPPR